jgi:putative flippase GtrA
VSVALSYFIGMIWGFYMTKTFAFNAKGSGNTQRELIKYSGVAFSALGLTVIMASLTLELFKWYIKENPENQALIRDLLNHPVLKTIDRKFVANLFGIGAGFFVNFFGHKFLTFRSTGTYDKYLVRKELRRQNKVRQ